MDQPEIDSRANGPGPTMPQTIVIDRGGRRPGRFILLLLGASLFANMMTCAVDLVARGALEERYYGGATGLTEPQVAIIEVKGAILDAEVDHVLRQIRQAREDGQVKGVVLRVDSPGGGVTGSDQIWREVEILKQRGKPVVASFGGTAASGGYYVAAAADAILAEPTCITGSIGVKLELLQLHDLMGKVGVSYETITTGPYKDTGSMYRPMTEDERARWRLLINDAYERFVSIVAQGRKLSLSAVKGLADGRVYTAHEAVQAKLVNRIGYLDDAILDVLGRAHLETARVIRYAKPVSLIDLVSSFGASTASRPGALVDADLLMKLRTPQLLYMAR